MKIIDIYENYKIMPNLQAHMLRVAGVASLIANSFQKDVDKKSIVTTCLIHDMGNIIKSNFDIFPEFIDEKGRDYWEKVKSDYIDKYGPDEHTATYEICKELGINQKVFGLIKAFGFSKGANTVELNDYNVKISSYSDFRVAPRGITTLQGRFDDLRKRYVEVEKPKHQVKDFNELVS